MSVSHQCEVESPSFRPGQNVYSGEFFRNIEGNDLSLCYRKDVPPYVYGRCLKAKSFRVWTETDSDGPSVNLARCLHENVCSIALHPQSTRFCGTVKFELQRLAKWADIELVAIYSPLELNPAHFHLFALDRRPEESVQAIDLKCKQLLVKDPNNPKSLSEWQIRYNEFAAIFSISTVSTVPPPRCTRCTACS